MSINIDQQRVKDLEAKHAKLWSSSPSDERLVTFGCSQAKVIDWSKMWNDPEALLVYCLERLERILALGDDTIPMIRVDLGTVLMPMAFGCESRAEGESMPAITSHPINNVEALDKVRNLDPMAVGSMVKAFEFIKYFRENMPEGIRLSQCDTQGPWNISHLLAGDSIFLDVFDNPDFVADLLDVVTDFLIRTISPMKEAIGEEEGRFYLQGTCCPGNARICNCSTDMIFPTLYGDLILERDNRFFETIGGGMLHNCASNIASLGYANSIKSLRCVEIAFNYADLFEVAKMIREDIVLLVTGPVDPPLLTPLGKATLDRFAKKEFPEKKNILYHLDDPADSDRAKWLLDVVKG